MDGVGAVSALFLLLCNADGRERSCVRPVRLALAVSDSASPAGGDQSTVTRPRQVFAAWR